MTNQQTRDYNTEYKDVSGRKYSYDFDDILRNYMMKTFEPFLPNGNALELGCFQGKVTGLLVNYFKDLTVVDAASDLIEIVNDTYKGKIKPVCSTFEDYEPKEKFDAIFLIHTLEHLDNAQFVLKKVKSWLSDNGKFFVAVPNANAPSRQIAVKMGLIQHNQAVTEAEREHGHRKTYAFDTLEREVVDAGLKVSVRGGVFFKGLANYQFDQAISAGIVSEQYLDGCYALGMQYPDLCASIYLICNNGKEA